ILFLLFYSSLWRFLLLILHQKLLVEVLYASLYQLHGRSRYVIYHVSRRLENGFLRLFEIRAKVGEIPTRGNLAFLLQRFANCTYVYFKKFASFFLRGERKNSRIIFSCEKRFPFIAHIQDYGVF